DLNDDGAEYADAPARALLAVFFVARHRVGDQRVHKPVLRVARLEVGAGRVGRLDVVDSQVADAEGGAHADRSVFFFVVLFVFLALATDWMVVSRTCSRWLR